MRRFLELIEQKENIVFTFGRFNPPTTGHEKLIKKVASVAGSNPFRIYPSYSQNQKKDPLPFALKIAYMRKMFSKYARNIVADKDARTAINIAVKLYDEGFKNLTMVAGSDRVKEFSSLLKNYNGVEGKRHGFYKFDSINVVSAGERDPDAEGISGMSASKMRAAAYDGDFDSFVQGVPVGFKDVKKLYLDVRKYMGIREERDMGEMNDFETLRDMYLTGKIWNIDDLIEANGVKGKIVRRGTNYVAFNDSDGKVHKAWLHEITLNERNYASEYKNYHSRPEQIARRSSRNKARRVMGINAIKGMDVGHKDNDPMNNNPDNLKNENPSDNRREPRLRDKKLDEIDIPYLIKNVIHRITHPKQYKDMIKDYIKRVANKDTRTSNGSILFDIARDNQLSRAKPLVDYINKLVSKGQLPKELKAQYKFTEFKNFIDIDKTNLNEKIEGLANKAKKSGMPYSILKKVYDRGMAAWKTGHRPGTTPQQWAMARVNSFVTKSSGTWGKADADLAKKVRGEEVKQDPDIKDREGTQPAKYYAKDTEGDEMSPSTKRKRATHFAKKKTGPAPGDATATTKPSQHTKKFKQMYGEMKEEPCCDDCLDEENPCWDGYKQVGMKMKNGKRVPNCVPEETEVNSWGEITEKDDKSGKELNNPTRGDVKKYKVYVKNDKGNVVKVEICDPNMEIKRDDPARRKAFRARHNCDNPGPKWKAKYWSCKFWSAKSVTDLMKG